MALPENCTASTSIIALLQPSWQLPNLESRGRTTRPLRPSAECASASSTGGHTMWLAFDRWRINDLKRELDAIGCHVPLEARVLSRNQGRASAPIERSFTFHYPPFSAASLIMYGFGAIVGGHLTQERASGSL